MKISWNQIVTCSALEWLVVLLAEIVPYNTPNSNMPVCMTQSQCMVLLKVASADDEYPAFLQDRVMFLMSIESF
jgi:hypothetical protein